MKLYSAIEIEAGRRGFQHHFVTYPGHSGISSGSLAYESARESALDYCRRAQPTWLIARSFGCNVAAGALGVGDAWVSRCRGAVLWGPFFNRAIEADFGTPAAMQQRRAEYHDYNVELADDFFSTLPDLKALIPKMRCNVRFARGSLDTYNTPDDLSSFRSIHERHMRDFVTEAIEVGGAEHKVVPGKVSEEVLASYLDCLFAPFGHRSEGYASHFARSR